jgi:signal transduction histidine kinase
MHRVAMMVQGLQRHKLQREFLLPLMMLTAAGGGLYLLSGMTWLQTMPLFPFDSLLLLIIPPVSYLIYRRQRIEMAARLLLVGLIWFVVFNMSMLGVQHIWTSLLMPCMIVSGLLMGQRFQWQMYGMSMMFVGMWATLELFGSNRDVADPVTTVGVWLEVMLFWGIAFGLTTLVVWLFARRLEQEFALAQAQSATLVRTIHDLRERTGLTRFLEQVLENIADLLNVHTATLVIQAQSDDISLPQIKLGYTDGQVSAADADDLLYFVTQPDSRIWQTVMQTGEHVLISDIANDDRLENRNALLTAQVQSVLAVPLRFNELSAGVLALSVTSKTTVSSQQIQVIGALSQHIILALQLSKLSEDAQQIAIMTERARLAREIHDTLMQGFVGVLTRLDATDTLLNQPDAHTDAIQKQIDSARQIARSSMDEARQSVRGMRPHVLTNNTLEDALQQMLHRVTHHTVVDATCEIDGDTERISADNQLHLLRISQEAVTNALKYASPTCIRLQLVCTSRRVRLQITDDGTGFDPAAVHQKGFGLAGMRERVQLMQGDISIQSEKHRGTTITVEYERQQADD